MFPWVEKHEDRGGWKGPNGTKRVRSAASNSVLFLQPLLQGVTGHQGHWNLRLSRERSNPPLPSRASCRVQGFGAGRSGWSDQAAPAGRTASGHSTAWPWPPRVTRSGLSPVACLVWPVCTGLSRVACLAWPLCAGRALQAAAESGQAQHWRQPGTEHVCVSCPVCFSFCFNLHLLSKSDTEAHILKSGPHGG